LAGSITFLDEGGITVVITYGFVGVWAWYKVDSRIFASVIFDADDGTNMRRKMDGILGDGVVDRLVDLVVAEFVQAGEVAETQVIMIPRDVGIRGSGDPPGAIKNMNPGRGSPGCVLSILDI
jgi:hypothetical protein